MQKRSGEPNTDFKLKEIFPYFCIDWGVITLLIKGRLYEKIMAICLFMVFFTLINPFTIIGVEFVDVATEEMYEHPGLLYGVWRLLYIFSVAIIAIVSVIFKSAFIPFLVYIAIIKGFFHIIGRVDALMSVLFIGVFFLVFVINKHDRSKSDIPIEDYEYTAVTDDDRFEAGEPKSAEERLEYLRKIHSDGRDVNAPPVLRNPPKKPVGELDDRFVSRENMTDAPVDIQKELDKLRDKSSFSYRLKRSFGLGAPKSEIAEYVTVTKEEVDRCQARKPGDFCDRFDDFRDERFK
jgi:hypothetical protein